MSYLDYINDKYDITSLSYPSDIQSPEYGGNMVVIYINVATASKFLPPPNQTYDMKDLDIQRDRGVVLGRPISSINAAVSSALGGAMGGLIGGVLGGFGSIATGATVIGGAAAWAAGDIAGTTTREQKRLKTAIALHMPNSLNIRYTTSWSEEDAGTVEALSQVGEDAIGLLKSLKDVNLSNMVPESSKNAGSTLGKDAKSIAASEALQRMGTMSARTGLAGNPKREMVFKGVDFRTFSFDYNFFPRDEKEAEHVYNIIFQLKLHMLPEYKEETNNFLYIYPSEFDISYFSGNGLNQYIHRHPSCVLTELSVNYTPNGNFTTFANGMPTQIAITMSFKELTNPTKESIQGRGY
jgi:hypothetical protein